MDKYQKRYGKVVVEFHYEDEDGSIVHDTVVRNISDGGENTYTIKDLNNLPMSRAAANLLATSTVEMLNEREEIWAKQHARGRTPGASSRPKTKRLAS